MRSDGQVRDKGKPKGEVQDGVVTVVVVILRVDVFSAKLFFGQYYQDGLEDRDGVEHRDGA